MFRLDAGLDRGLWLLASLSRFDEGSLSSREAEEVAYARQHVLEHFGLEDDAFLEQGRRLLEKRYGAQRLDPVNRALGRDSKPGLS